MGMCGQWRRLRALALIGVSVLAGCDFTGAQSADRIDQALKPLPGVSSVSHTVGRNGGFGPTEVSFDVYVRDEATTDQLSALTHVFTDQIHASRAFRTPPARSARSGPPSMCGAGPREITCIRRCMSNYGRR
ncbi:Uncharacterised protein [Mycobacteroides abscessus subsp. abscessus]|nr:Uncharacterised protein [Mycobacteroides abscessus subsp. abscessus]SKW01506.1 Uncharacterised protein [Mycobacteroides abscessus subsp. abscessus]